MVGDVPGRIFGTHHKHGLYCKNDSLFGIKLKNSTRVNSNGNDEITTGKEVVIQIFSQVKLMNCMP